MSWLVGRFEPGDLPWSQAEEMAAWIRSLGLDPTDIALRAAVVQGKDLHELHLVRYLRNADGCMYLNAAVNEPASESVIVVVEKDSWPQWLTGLGCGIERERIIGSLRAENAALAALVAKSARDDVETPESDGAN